MIFNIQYLNSVNILLIFLCSDLDFTEIACNSGNVQILGGMSGHVSGKPLFLSLSLKTHDIIPVFLSF